MKAPRVLALSLLAAVAAVAPAGCGSGSTSSSTSSAAVASAGPAAGGGAPDPAARAKLTACLKQHGVALPARPAGARTRTTGQGGYGPPAGGAGAGFLGGDGRFSNPKTRAAFQACAKSAGLNFRGAGAGVRPTKAAIATFASCVKKHGFTLPAANLTGKGPIYPRTIETNQTFQTAARACQSLLRPTGGPGGAPAGAAPPGA